MNGQPWFAWEWLYDLLVGWLETAAGLNGVVLFTALVIALVFAWTFRLLLRRGTNILVAVVLVLLAASAAMIHFLARPHVVSWLFTVAWFWILESSERVVAHLIPIPRGVPGPMCGAVGLLMAAAAADAAVGESAWWISAGLCAACDLLVQCRVAVAKAGAETGSTTSCGRSAPGGWFEL